jgi:hypothetical protein
VIAWIVLTPSCTAVDDAVSLSVQGPESPDEIAPPFPNPVLEKYLVAIFFWIPPKRALELNRVDKDKAEIPSFL